MQKLLIRLGLAVLGLGLSIAWWTIRGNDSKVQSVAKIPVKVLAGGNQLEVFAEASTASTMRISFSDLSKPSGSQQIMQSWEKILAGTRSWTIDVPSGVGGYIELGADHPNAGDTLTVRLKMNGKDVDHQTERLNGALEPNTAFFVQFHYDDYSKAGMEATDSESAPES
jgi:hypothetical protein